MELSPPILKNETQRIGNCNLHGTEKQLSDLKSATGLVSCSHPKLGCNWSMNNYFTPLDDLQLNEQTKINSAPWISNLIRTQKST